MELSAILRPEAVRVMPAVSSRKRLFQELGELCRSAFELEPAAVVDALMQRESLAPTAVGHGVALPHARLPGLAGVVGGCVLLKKPIDLGAVDRQPVDIAFALFAPEDAGVDHLKALALVSRTLRDSAVRAKLRANPDPVTMYTILTERAPAPVL